VAIIAAKNRAKPNNNLGSMVPQTPLKYASLSRYFTTPVYETPTLSRTENAPNLDIRVAKPNIRL
jgi:hypothetical protein